MKVVRGYTHHDGSIGVLAMFEVGTDFTSRTPEFKTFSDDVLMSIAFWIRDIQSTKLAPGENPISVDDVSNALRAPWIGVGAGDFETVQQAFDAASKQFREPILLSTIRHLSA